MTANFEMIDKEFNNALRRLSLESKRAASEVITFNARDFLKSLKFNTPKRTGNGRAGWWPAWRALDMPGSPSRRQTGKRKIRFRGLVQEYTADGRIDDQRTNRINPYFEFSNEATVTDNKTGKQIRYLWVHNARSGFLDKSKQEATFKYNRSYQRLLKKYSAK